MRRVFGVISFVGIVCTSILLLLSTGELLLLTSAINLEFRTVSATVKEVRELDNDMVRVSYSYEVEGKTYRNGYSIPGNRWADTSDETSVQIEANYLVAFPSYGYVNKEYDVRKAKFGIAAFSVFLAILILLHRRLMGGDKSFEAYRRVFTSPEK